MAPNMFHGHLPILHFVRTFMPNLNTTCICMRWMQLVYYQRCLFSCLELHTSNNWWTTVPKHASRSLYNMLLVCISSITPNPGDICNSITLITTPLFTENTSLLLKQQSSYNLQAIWSLTYIPVSLFCVQVYIWVYTTMNLKAPMTAPHTKQPPYYKGHSLSPSTKTSHDLLPEFVYQHTYKIHTTYT